MLWAASLPQNACLRHVKYLSGTGAALKSAIVYPVQVLKHFIAWAAYAEEK